MVVMITSYIIQTLTGAKVNIGNYWSEARKIMP